MVDGLQPWRFPVDEQARLSRVKQQSQLVWRRRKSPRPLLVLALFYDAANEDTGYWANNPSSRKWYHRGYVLVMWWHSERRRVIVFSMFVTKPNSHVYMCQGAIMPPDLAAQMRASMTVAPGPCSDVFQSRDERQQRLVLKRNRLIQELSPKRLDGTTLRLRTPEGLYIAHRPATQEGSSREVVLRRPRSSPQGGRRTQQPRPSTVAGLTTNSLPGAVTPTRLILAAAQAVRARSALAQDPGKPTQEPTSEPTIAAMHTSEVVAGEATTSSTTALQNYRPASPQVKVTCSQPPLRIRPHSAHGEGGLSAYFRALTSRSTRRLPGAQWGYTISPATEKDPKFFVGKEAKPKSESLNVESTEQQPNTPERNNEIAGVEKQELQKFEPQKTEIQKKDIQTIGFQKTNIFKSESQKTGVHEMGSETAEVPPHVVQNVEVVEEWETPAAPVKPPLPAPVPPLVVGNGHILDRVNAAERTFRSTGVTRGACMEPEKRTSSRPASRPSTPGTARCSPPRGQIITNTCKPGTPPPNTPTSKFDFHEALLARPSRAVEYFPPPPSPRSVDAGSSTTTAIPQNSLPTQCVATITVHKDSTFVLGDSVCRPGPMVHQNGRPSWPSAVDIQELGVGGFRYKPKSGGEWELGADWSSNDGVEKAKSSPRGAIIVPSHTMLDCPLCNLYSEDGHEEHVEGLVHSPIPSRGTPKPSSPTSTLAAGYKHRGSSTRGSKSERMLNKRQSIIVALSRPAPVATVKSGSATSRSSEAIQVPVVQAVQNGIRKNVFKYTYIKTPGGAGKAQVRTTELVQES